MTDNRVFAGPALVDDIAVQYAQTSTYLCFNLDQVCAKFQDSGSQRKVVRAYLSDLLGNRNAATSAMSRLFASVGVSLSAIGWPEGPWFNRFVTVAIPSALASASYVHWNRLEALAPGATRAILPVGLHTFYMKGAAGGAIELTMRASRHNGRVSLLTVAQRPLDVRQQFQSTPSRIEPDLDRYCMDKPVDPSEPMYHSQGGGRVTPSDFAAAENVSIAFAGTAKDCDATCERWIGADVVQSLAQWRAGCAGCSATTLSAVRVNGDLYVSDRFVYWSQFQDDENHASATDANPYRMSELLTANGGINSTMGYQRIQDTPMLPLLCGEPAADDALPTGTRKQLCGASIVPKCIGTGCLSIPVVLTGTKECSGFIACGAPDHTVTLNTSEFNFSLFQLGLGTGALQGAIGSPSIVQRGTPIPLYPILLHEVGHWFGLPHVDSDVGDDGRDEVMRATGGNDKVCISRAALIMVSNAVNKDWAFRLKTLGGLRYASQ